MPPWAFSGGKEFFTCQCRRYKRRRFDPWVRKISWSRKSQPTPIFLPGKFMDRGAWWATIHGVTRSQTQMRERAPTQMPPYSGLLLPSYPLSVTRFIFPKLTRAYYHFISPKHVYVSLNLLNKVRGTQMRMTLKIFQNYTGISLFCQNSSTIMFVVFQSRWSIELTC